MSRKRTIDRNAVLDAAENIVTTLGASALTIDAVAKASGITKGGVQYCFGSKHDMIAAMVERWSREFDADVHALTGEDPSPEARLKGHIGVTSHLDQASGSRASVMMASMLQAPGEMDKTRDWYLERLGRLDLANPEGRRLRLAFLACEGAFLLRSFNFMPMTDAEWAAIFKDIADNLIA